jgi:hypothetical protein
MVARTQTIKHIYIMMFKEKDLVVRRRKGYVDHLGQVSIILAPHHETPVVVFFEDGKVCSFTGEGFAHGNPERELFLESEIEPVLGKPSKDGEPFPS